MRSQNILKALGLVVVIPASAYADGALADPSFLVSPTTAGSRFGESVADAGDVNGDGYSDVIVGAPSFDGAQTDEGRAFLYLGSASGTQSTPAWEATSGLPNGRFGTSVACAGDVNSDGFDDVVIGAPGVSNGQSSEGRAYLYLGSASGLSLTPAWVHEIDLPTAGHGRAVACAGDVDNDGSPDVIVGSPNLLVFSPLPLNQAGRADIYRGGATGLSMTSSWTVTGDQGGQRFGAAVGTAGDLDQDGCDDWIVGAPGAFDLQAAEGWIYVFAGSASSLSMTPVFHAEGNQVAAELGSSVAGLGDIDADGFADIAAGAPGYDDEQNGEGSVFVFRGSATGPSAPVILQNDLEDSQLGVAIARAGDVNGDGFADLLAGAPKSLGPAMQQLGNAALYLGSANGISSQPAWITPLSASGWEDGRGVGGGGDVNGDGFADLLIGQPGHVPTNLYGRVIGFQGGACLTAGAHSYGAGKPGVAGTPSLQPLGPPHLGQQAVLALSSAPITNPVLFFVGGEQAAVPFDGGRLLVNPQLVLALQFTIGTFPVVILPIPNDPLLCGTSVFLQAMWFDPLASSYYQTAQTNGVYWRIGG